MQKIIYQTVDGGVAVITPTGELSIEEVARKDVPAGVPYKIVDESEIPSDRTFRNAWEVEITTPDGVGIGCNAWFIEQFEAEIAEINAMSAPQQPEGVSDEDYQAAVAEWEQQKAARIAFLNTHIAIQQAEMSQ